MCIRDRLDGVLCTPTASAVFDAGERLLNDMNHSRLQKTIEHLARRYTEPHCEYDDLVQEGWAGALEALGRYDDIGGASRLSWAKIGARGAMLKYVRKQRQLRGWFTSRPSEVIESFGGDGLADRATTVVTVREFLEGLSGRQREVCDAVLAGADSMSEVGRDIGISTWYACYLRKRIAQKLESHLLSGKHQEGLVL